MPIAPDTCAFTRRDCIAVVALLVLAVVARAPFFIGTSFPLNDGGMFAQMVDDLRNNHFALPYQTTYNLERIPFCYPPLGFYLGALAQAMTGASTLEVLRWLPLLFNLVSMCAFYLAALELFRERTAAFCAALLYAALPRSGEWLTMGGGLTRAPAELFVLLSVWAFLRARNTRRFVWITAAGVFAGLAVLTHLEAGILAGVSLCVLALFNRPWKLQTPDLLVAAATAVVVVAPWLIWVLVSHGASPFLAAFDTRGTSGTTSVRLPLLYGCIWFAVAIVMWLLRQLPLAVWILATEICVSRSAPTHTAIMFALLGGLLVTALFRRGTRSISIAAVLAVSMLVYYIPRHHFPGNRLRDLVSDTRAALTGDNVKAMRWVAEHIPAGARFFVFNQRIDPWFGDFVGEWFPYLAHHESVYTAQGKEWLQNHAFQNAVRHIPACLNIRNPEQVDKSIEPQNFDALFLSGPYDPPHARCAAALRELPGMHLAYRLGENEVFVRTP